MQEFYLIDLLKKNIKDENNRFNQYRARENLKDFYSLLNYAKEDNEYVLSNFNSYSINVFYMNYIPVLYKYLLKGDYISTCEKIIDILNESNYYGILWQNRDKNALLILLEREFIDNYIYFYKFYKKEYNSVNIFNKAKHIYSSIDISNIKNEYYRQGILSFYYILEDYELNKEQKNELINILLKIIKIDIKLDQFNKLLYPLKDKNYNLKENRKEHIFFPSICKNEKENYKKEIDLSKDIVIFNKIKFKSFIDNLKNKMNKKIANEDIGYYYKGLDISFINNLEEKDIKKKEKIELNVIDVQNFFDLIDINDDFQYIDDKTKEILDERHIDHRMALLYKISKEKRIWCSL